MVDKDTFPFLLSGDFKDACVGCEALNVTGKISYLTDDEGQEVPRLNLSCANRTVCEALEHRPEKAPRCNPGDLIWFANGQTGKIKELAFCGCGAPVIRCVKRLDDEGYEVEYGMNDLGSVIFLSQSELIEYKKSQTKE